MNVGFTGTRKGMTTEQKIALYGLLQSMIGKSFHHGDCLGADDEAANLAHFHGIKTVCHPPVETAHQACNPFADETRKPKTHFARNRDIVNETDILIACPCDMTDQQRGGTWYTIGYAKKNSKLTHIIWPDGRVETRNA